MIPTVTPTNTHIEGSCFCRPPKTIKAYLIGLRERVASPEYTICARSLRSLTDEWEAHNLLYSLGIARGRTESVDLDEARWHTEIAYYVLASFYRLTWKMI